MLGGYYIGKNNVGIIPPVLLDLAQSPTTPTPNPKNFPPTGEYIIMLPVSYARQPPRQLQVSPHSLSQFSFCRQPVRLSSSLSSTPYYTQCYKSPPLLTFWTSTWITLWFFAMDSDKDLPTSTRSRLKEFSWGELMAAYCSPSSIVQCWDACAIYKSFRECLLKWNFHIKIHFNILT